MAISVDDILQAAEEHQASDIFIQEGEVPRMKINEQLMIFGDEPLLLPHVAGLWQACGGDTLKDMDVDTGMVSRSGIRFRVNLHKVLGRWPPRCGASARTCRPWARSALPSGC
jgi:Tfp pilus assembly pilus retraction ATPase PilT